MIRGTGYMAGVPFPVDPQDPLAPARGLGLDGLMEELQNEVERRLARVSSIRDDRAH
jgi:hypothetical protein